MKSTSKKSILGTVAVTAALLLSFIVPTAQANSYVLPDAPTKVTSRIVADGVFVKWTPPAGILPAVTGYVVSAGAGSCPIYVHGGKRTGIVMPVVVGQPAGTPFVQAVNAYGFSKPGTSGMTHSAADLAKVASTQNQAVQILQLSDLHGAIEVGTSAFGAAGLASNWDADRAANKATIAISSGDNFGAAPPISTEFEELPTVEALNLAKLDVSIFGNHEHDRNLTHLNKMIGASDFQWVVSNYPAEALATLKSGTKAAKSFTVIDRGGVKIGVVGANTSETIDQIFPGNLDYTNAAGVKKTIEIEKGVKGVNAAIVDAKAAGADIVVVALHQGWSENSEGTAKGIFVDMAKEIKGATAIYGGHSHQTFAAVMPGNTRIPPIALGQVRNAGVEYTRTQICMINKKVVGQSVQHVLKAALTATNTPINTSVVSTVTAQDAAAAAMVKKYKDAITPKLDVKIGRVSAQFPIDGTPRVQRSGENPMGNYIADAMRAKYKTDFALMNGGGIRDSFPAKNYVPVDTTLVRTGTGPLDVTLGDALTVYPFGNQIATTVVTGSNLWTALENGVGGTYPTDGRFPNISGFKFSFDASKAIGSRIVSVTKLDGTPIAKDSKEYTLATPDFIIYGGDGYTNVFTPSKAKVQGALLDLFVDSLKADLAAGKVTNLPTADGRIVKVG
jgi:5'-nucleotidase